MLREGVYTLVAENLQCDDFSRDTPKITFSQSETAPLAKNWAYGPHRELSIFRRLNVWETSGLLCRLDGFNGAESYCGIARILGILLTNS